MKKRNIRLWIILGIAAIVIAGLFMWSRKNQDKGIAVEMEKVQKRTITEKVSASGKIFPETEVKMSSDVSGQVVELLVMEGDSVTKGQLMARIDPEIYQSQVERGSAGVNISRAQASNATSEIARVRATRVQLQAQKDNAEAQLANTKKLYDRQVQLRKEGVISDQDLEQSQSTLRSAESALRSADASLSTNDIGLQAAQKSAEAAKYQTQTSEASLKEVRTSLKRTSVFAPVSGIVSKLNVEKGERVVGSNMMSGTEIMRIADLSKMEVRVDVSENDIPRIKLNDDVDVDVDAYLDRKFKGRVTEIAQSSSSSSSLTASLNSDQATNFVVKILLDPASYRDLIGKTSKNRYPFRPGMSASVEINTNTKENILTIPIQAVTTRDKKVAKVENPTDNQKDKKAEARKDVKEVVFVTVADSVKMVEVKVGIQDNDYIEIKSGLTDGETVVVGPYDVVARKLEQGSKWKQKEEKKDVKKQ
jgi:HlyD family secretion protein